MKYEFATLDHLIGVTLHPVRLLNLKPAEIKETKNQWVTIISEEKTRICDTVYQAFYASSNLEIAEKYIRNQLRATSALSEQLRLYAMEAAAQGKKDILEIYLAASTELEGIFPFILKYFDDYFDFELPMPLLTARSAKASLSDKVKLLYEKFPQNPDVKHLLNVVFLPIQDFLEHPDATIAYRLFFYYDSLVQVLLQLKAVSAEERNFELHAILHFMNFNAPEYIEFAVTNLLLKIADLTPDQKMERLRWYIKTIKQVESTHSLPLSIAFPHPVIKKLLAKGTLAPNPEAPPVTQQISAWIDEEMQFVVYNHKIESGSILPGKGDGSNLEKISTSLSVAKLAVFVEVFIGTGIFKSDNAHSYAATLRTVARVVYTPGAETLSHESLRAKAYALRKLLPNGNRESPSKKTIESCKDLFLDCYNACAKMLK